jgi:hypothetical protein
MNIKMLFSAVLIAYFVALGCSNPAGPNEEPPTFSMASIKVQCGADDCIQFFARPDKDVTLVKVVITPPAGDKITYNLGNATVVAGEEIGLQDPNIAYTRISGEWKFVFTGNLATGDKSSFEVTTTVSVSA